MNNSIPILGQTRINKTAIQLVEATLEKLKRGELINVAIVAEQAHDGQLYISYDCSAEDGAAAKLRGGLAIMGTSIDMKVLGSK